MCKRRLESGFYRKGDYKIPQRINEDHQSFHDVYAGRKRKALQKYTSTGEIFRKRAKDGKHIIVRSPTINIPHIIYGDNGEGVGRGPGEKGKVIGRDKGQGQGSGGGGDEADGIEISIDLEEVLKFLQDELKLPDLKPKPNQTYEDIKKKYNDISRVGTESLRHNRKTMLRAMKRLCSTGEINKLHQIPGFIDPVKLITPIPSDKRYRQWKEIRYPASNAAIFFARDGSASMDATRCEIVNDMAWWIDVWIRRYYKRVERCYIWHDVAAQEVDENKFYTYRYGGGTTCSSALKLILKQMEDRFNPSKWNIYVIYFTDGENISGDNAVFCDLLRDHFTPDVVNMVGICQILAWSYGSSLKESVDKELAGITNIKTSSIVSSKTGAFGSYDLISDEERGEQVKKATIDLLGAGKKK